MKKGIKILELEKQLVKMNYASVICGKKKKNQLVQYVYI